MQAAHDNGPAVLRTLLRCMGQTVLQCNALTGACVLAALALCDLRLACAAIIGALAAHVCAVIGHYDPIAMRDGLHGFNGVLCALAAVTFVNDTRIALAVALLSAIAATCLAAPWSHLLSTRGLAVYSSPCLVVTWCWLLLRAGARMPADHASASNASASLGPLYTQALRIRFPLDAAFGVGHLVRPPSPIGNVLASAAQTVFASGAWPGLLIVVGIALASRRAALHTLAGAAVSSAVAWTCGAPLGALHTGMAGFNGALAALALCDRGPVATLAAAMLSALLYQAVAHMGWPAMSAPFVVAAWCVHACMRAFDRQRPFAH